MEFRDGPRVIRVREVCHDRTARPEGLNKPKSEAESVDGLVIDVKTRELRWQRK